MADGLNFNIFDELENDDPRVAHFLQSRLRWKNPAEACPQRGPTAPTVPTRVYVANVPERIHEFALKEILSQFGGNFVEYRRHRDSRLGRHGLTYLFATFDSEATASAVVQGLKTLNLGAGVLEAQLAVDKVRRKREALEAKEAEILRERRLTEEFLEESRRRRDQLCRSADASAKDSKTTMMELPLNKPINVSLAEIDTGRHFYFLPNGWFTAMPSNLDEVNPNLLTQIKRMELEISNSQSFIDGRRPPDPLLPGADVFGWYEDNYFRAVVLELLPRQESKIFFFDYGNVEVVKNDQLRPLTQKFRDICPRIRHLCKIANVEPKNGGFAPDNLRWMTDFISAERRIVGIEVVAKEKLPNLVLHSAKVTVRDSSLQSTISLQEELLNLNFVVSTEATYSSYPVKFYDMPTKRFDRSQTFRCIVSDYNDPSNFWVSPEKDDHRLTRLQEELLAAARGEHPPSNPPELDDMVAALWSDGEQEPAFYRARVIYVRSEGIGVRFVDYGNADAVQLRDVRPLRPEMAKLEMQAFDCALLNCQPLDGRGWDVPSIQRARQTLASNNLRCEVRNTIDGKRNVILRDGENSTVNEKLLSMGIAAPSAPVRGAFPPADRGGPRGGVGPYSVPSLVEQPQLPRLKEPPPTQRQNYGYDGFEDRNQRPQGFDIPPSFPVDSPPRNAHLARPVPSMARPNGLLRSPLSPHSTSGPLSPSGSGSDPPPSYSTAIAVESSSFGSSKLSALPQSTGLVDEVSLLRHRVEQLESTVEEQRKTIFNLEALLKSREESALDVQRLENLETTVAALKRAHEGVEKDLIRKGLL